MRVIWGAIAVCPWLIAFLFSAIACIVAPIDYLLEAFTFGDYSIAFIYEGLFSAAGSIIKYTWIPSVFIFLVFRELEDRENDFQEKPEISSQ